jgi:transcriptional regulator with XRE-family HTH domain
MPINKRKTPKSDKAIAFLEGLIKEKLTISNLVWAIRESEEMSQKEFAKLLGIAPQYLCDVEHGRRSVSPKLAAGWAKKLGYSPEQFVELAIQDELEKSGLHFNVQVKAA